MKKSTCKELIKKALYFQGAFTTDVFLRIKEQGGQAGIKSVTRRLEEGKGTDFIGRKVDGHREKFWEINKGILL